MPEEGFELRGRHLRKRANEGAGQGVWWFESPSRLDTGSPGGSCVSVPGLFSGLVQV